MNNNNNNSKVLQCNKIVSLTFTPPISNNAIVYPLHSKTSLLYPQRLQKALQENNLLIDSS
eukprot:UN06400